MQTITAIDVGSIAIRLVVGRVNNFESIAPLENLRLPIQPGSDAFPLGALSERTLQAAADTFLRFRKIANDFAVTHIRAVATSAMREASKSDLLIDRVGQQTDTQIEVITGENQARLIHQAVRKATNFRNRRAILVDICISAGGNTNEKIMINKG